MRSRWPLWQCEAAQELEKRLEEQAADAVMEQRVVGRSGGRWRLGAARMRGGGVFFFVSGIYEAVGRKRCPFVLLTTKVKVGGGIFFSFMEEAEWCVHVGVCGGSSSFILRNK